MRSFFVTSLAVLMWVFFFFSGYIQCQWPTVVNVGAVFAHNSVIGRVAKVALEAAVADVNADPNILNGTQLKLIMEDAECNVFLGSVTAFQVLENEVVAIIGPVSSSVAHMISFITSGLQVPLLSFAATDPTLSSLQFPFFLRTTQSDSYQMTAMAELIDYYEWRDVIAIFEENDYGRNGISILEDELEKKMSKISYKLALPIEFDLNHITDLLSISKFAGPRVYVVHLSPDSGLAVFAIAAKLQMMTSNYVWLATEWLAATLDSFSHINGTLLRTLQGVVGFRQHTLKSSQKNAFLSRWKEFQHRGLVNSELNTYGLNAYDTLWVIARSVDGFLQENGNITFSDTKAETDLLQKMIKTFDGGTLLLGKLLNSKFTGLTGHIQFDVNRNLIGSGYEIINVNGMTISRIGYWSNHSGFSVIPPETLDSELQNFSRVDQKLENVTWPGGTMDKPRGSIVGDRKRPLRIGVPKRVSFTEFVMEEETHDSHKILGFCVDVFEAAWNLVPFEVFYTLEAFGDGRSNPSADYLVKLVADNVIDAAVGDIYIDTTRMENVDFTQPYMSSSLVIVAPTKSSKPSAWVFLQPFSMEMWCVSAAFFILIGVVFWFLEHRLNNSFRGPPRRQVTTIFVFSFSTLFKANKEQILSTLGRVVMVVWLFLIMVLKSSYTASLTSILTVQQLSSPIMGIDDLIENNWPIGYQVGSFSQGYLMENFKIHRSRLVPLGSPEEYERALRRGPKNGGVAAVVDELPYVELFLSKHTEFGIVGRPLTQSGWGFAFQRDSHLTSELSTAILSLSESGELHRIRKKWLCKLGCSKGSSDSDSGQFDLGIFWGIFILFGAFLLTVILVFFLRSCQFMRHKRPQIDDPSSTSFSSAPSSKPMSIQCSQMMRNFVDFMNEKEGSVKKKVKSCHNPQHQASSSTVYDIQKRGI